MTVIYYAPNRLCGASRQNSDHFALVDIVDMFGQVE